MNLLEETHPDQAVWLPDMDSNHETGGFQGGRRCRWLSVHCSSLPLEDTEKANAVKAFIALRGNQWQANLCGICARPVACAGLVR